VIKLVLPEHLEAMRGLKKKEELVDVLELLPDAEVSSSSIEVHLSLLHSVPEAQELSSTQHHAFLQPVCIRVLAQIFAFQFIERAYTSANTGFAGSLAAAHKEFRPDCAIQTDDVDVHWHGAGGGARQVLTVHCHQFEACNRLHLLCEGHVHRW
jgi:hypothetical protein